MKDWLDFFKSKAFIANLILAGIILLVVSVLTFRYLGATTHHGESVVVPNLVGKQMLEAEDLLNEADLEYEIIDSAFVENMPKGAIVSQLPEAKEKVKDGRTIYLTINASNAPKVTVPDLVNLSLRQAVSTLNALGLKYETQYRPDICKDCVLAQMYADRSLAPGTEIAKGETIVLVLGMGDGVVDSTNAVEDLSSTDGDDD